MGYHRQRIAEKYESAWNGLVHPFIPYLLNAAGVRSKIRILDAACGPGYVAKAAFAEAFRVIRPGGWYSFTASIFFRSVTIEWKVPSVSYLFECERDAGVRNAAVLAAQKPEILEAIRNQIEDSVSAYAKDDGFAIPFTAHVIAVRAL